MMPVGVPPSRSRIEEPEGCWYLEGAMRLRVQLHRVMPLLTKAREKIDALGRFLNQLPPDAGRWNLEIQRALRQLQGLTQPFLRLTFPTQKDVDQFLAVFETGRRFLLLPNPTSRDVEEILRLVPEPELRRMQRLLSDWALSQEHEVRLQKAIQQARRVLMRGCEVFGMALGEVTDVRIAGPQDDDVEITHQSDPDITLRADALPPLPPQALDEF